MDEFSNDLLFWIQKDGADSMQFVVIEIAQIGRFIEDGGAGLWHVLHALDVALAL